MNKDLIEFSLLSDEMVKDKLAKLLKRIYLFKISIKSPQKPSKGNTNTAHIIPYRIRQRSRDIQSADNRRSSEPGTRNFYNITPQAGAGFYEVEALLCFQNVFNKLFEQYRNTEWVKSEEEKKCSVLVIKQFFLDCFAAEFQFYSSLTSSLAGKEWVSFNDFLMCYKSVNAKNAGLPIRSSKIYKRKEERHTQKLICKFYLVFFQLVRFVEGNELTREGVEKVLNLSLSKSKAFVQQSADGIMKKVSEGQGSRVDRVRFKDFFSIILKEYSESSS